MQAGCKANDSDLETILPMAEKRAFVQKVSSDRASKISGRIRDVDDDWDFNCMVATKEVAASSASVKLRDVQQPCEKSGNAESTMIVESIEPAQKNIETKCKNATLARRVMDVQGRLEKFRAA